MILSEQAKFLFGDIEKNEQALIDAFVEVYGEDYREHITKVIQGCHIDFFTDYDSFYEKVQSTVLQKLCQNWGDEGQRKALLDARDKALKAGSKNAINPQDFTQFEQRKILHRYESDKIFFAIDLLRLLIESGVSLNGEKIEKIERITKNCGHNFENVLAYLEKISPGILSKIDFDREIKGRGTLKSSLIKSKRSVAQTMQKLGEIDSTKEVGSKAFFIGGTSFDSDKFDLLGFGESEFANILYDRQSGMAFAYTLQSKADEKMIENVVFMRCNNNCLSDHALIHELEHRVAAFVRDMGAHGYVEGTGLTFKSDEVILQDGQIIHDIGLNYTDGPTTALNEALTDYKAKKITKVFRKNNKIFEAESFRSYYDVTVDVLTPVFDQMGQDAIDTSIRGSEFNIPLVYGFETFEEMKCLAYYLMEDKSFQEFEKKYGFPLTPEWIESHPEVYEKYINQFELEQTIFELVKTQFTKEELTPKWVMNNEKIVATRFDSVISKLQNTQLFEQTFKDKFGVELTSEWIASHQQEFETFYQEFEKKHLDELRDTIDIYNEMFGVDFTCEWVMGKENIDQYMEATQELIRIFELHAQDWGAEYLEVLCYAEQYDHPKSTIKNPKSPKEAFERVSKLKDKVMLKRQEKEVIEKARKQQEERDKKIIDSEDQKQDSANNVPVKNTDDEDEWGR